AAVGAAAFAAGKGGACDGSGNEQQIFQIAGEMPARIEHARAINANLTEAQLEFLKFADAFFEIFFVAEDANEILHRFLQIVVNGIWEFATGAFKGSEHFALSLFELRGIDIWRGRARRKLDSGVSGAAPEDQQIGE